MFFQIILTRMLFVACMVFIIGYVFGNFSAKPILRTITRIATVLAIVLFITSNVLFFRYAAWNNHAFNRHASYGWCTQDTASHK